MGYKIPRLEQIIKFKVANVFQREIADPRMGMLTVTEVKLAKDLGHCVVRYSVLGDEGARSKTERLLEDSRGFIQREVAKILRTRRAPQLEFEFDQFVRLRTFLERFSSEQVQTLQSSMKT